VDHDVMVEPAEKHQILLVGTASLRPGGFVVSLEAISGITAVGGAPTLVFVDESPFQGRRHGALPTPVVEISALFGPGDDLGSRIAEDGLKGLTSHPGTGLEHHPGLTISGSRFYGVDDDRHLDWWCLIGSADLTERLCPTPPSAHGPVVRKPGELVGGLGQRLVDDRPRIAV
jgi:hypothetical protein